MDNLNNILENQKIMQIHETIKEFIHSADGYANRLKLVFALLAIIEESSSALQAVDTNDYIDEVRDKISQLKGRAERLAIAYHSQIAQNKEIYSILADASSDKVANIEHQIEKLLKEYDSIIKGVVEVREQLPLQGQLKAQGIS